MPSEGETPQDNPDPTNRRRDERYDPSQASTLWYRDTPFSCMLINISAAGALVELDSFTPPVGAEVRLEFQGVGQSSATIIRTGANLAGLKFID